MNIGKRHISLRYWFIPLDLIVTFAIVMLSFLANTGISSLTIEAATPILIYAASISLFTVIVFGVTKIYKMITSEFGIFESGIMFVITLVIQIIGLIVIACVDQLPVIARFGWGWAIATIALCFSLPSMRLFSRLLIGFIKVRKKKENVRTLVIGAGSAAKIVIDESRKNPNNHNKVVALVDDDPNKIGRTFGGLPVAGPISKVKSIIEFYNIEEVIIAISALNKEQLYNLFKLLVDSNVRVRRMPTLDEMDGPNEAKIIEVNLDDLLSRNPVSLDNTQVFDMLKDKTVIVTGAGGSIGSELVRQIYNTKPKTLILFDIYENSTYDIQQELRMRMRDEGSSLNLVTLIGSTYDETTMEHVFKKYRPDYIYHAAAYKHVPLMEDSPQEAIRTNVIGTYNVARLADKYHAKKMVLVSTDKAVRPTNAMGATKRFAETIIQYFSIHSKDTAYSAVRFGNVLGSNGSVVPLFKKQIEAGGPITLTDNDITRYFMTIPEAVSLILQCGLFAKGGEIFILDMGNPIKIRDLAERLIRQAGLTPGKDIDIIETGLRPGEKLYEEMLLDKTRQIKTENDLIYIEPTEEKEKPIEQEIKDIVKAFDMEDDMNIKVLLKSIISDYEIDKRKIN